MAVVSSAPTAVDPRVRWRPGVAGTVARFAVLAAIAAVVLAIPHLLDPTLVNVYSKAMVYGIVALSMNVLIGYAGQVSLGHQAFVGVGAFSSAFFLSESGLPWLVAVILTIVLGAFIALGLGAVSLRVKGLYFALVTIAYGIFVQSSIFGITRLTGGGAGADAPRPTFATGDITYGYVCVAALVLVWLFDWRLTASRAGRAIEALRDDERVAASWGINVKGYKLLAFSLAGGVAALGGALFASIEQKVSPLTFGLTLALIFVLMTVVGGLRSRPGVVIGGFIFAILPTVLEKAHSAWGETGTEGTGPVCATLPPNLIQLGMGLLVVAGAAAFVAQRARRTGWTAGTMASAVIGGFVGLAVLGTFAIGGFTGGFCLWAAIDAQWEPLIGALLLILTLTLFPGGIAQQNEHLFRWLAFQPFHGTGGGSATHGGADGAGGTDARP